ncbi:MAG: MoxR family ATPase [Spirochaetaceae bacterium]|nr:MAG: MoxR family ATPase [Spirochaetaceae bacterium]
MTQNDTEAFVRRVRESVEQAIVGKSALIETVVASLLCGGHVLFEDYPGLGKTMLAQSLAQSMELEFTRIQFTPDLLPGDITGGYVYNREAGTFELRTGPVFTNVLLADELNRASPKTQSALLEAMQEGQVTIDGETHALPDPFIVLATQNPIEYEGTFPLPEAQLDRFLVKLSVGYPSAEEEREILRRRRDRKVDGFAISPVASRDEVIRARAAVEEVHVHTDLDTYIVALVQRTRVHSGVAVGSSPRGSLAIMKLARARAASAGRGFVIPDDVKESVVPALSHRIVLAPELWTRSKASEEIVRSILASTPVPVVDP